MLLHIPRVASNSGDEIKEEDIHNCLQALQEMLGQTDAAETDLQTSLKPLPLTLKLEEIKVY